MTHSLDAERHGLFERAMRFPMDTVLVTYAEKQNLSLEAARAHEQELKRYLALCAMNPEVNYGMKGQVDKLWHEFILFTEAYATFCENVSGRFLHHRPHVPGQIDADDAGDGYERFLADYESAYGESAPADIWPRASDEVLGTLGDAPTTSPCGCYVATGNDVLKGR